MPGFLALQFIQSATNLGTHHSIHGICSIDPSKILVPKLLHSGFELLVCSYCKQVVMRTSPVDNGRENFVSPDFKVSIVIFKWEVTVLVTWLSHTTASCRWLSFTLDRL